MNASSSCFRKLLGRTHEAVEIGATGGGGVPCHVHYKSVEKRLALRRTVVAGLLHQRLRDRFILQQSGRSSFQIANKVEMVLIESRVQAKSRVREVDPHDVAVYQMQTL